MKRQEPRAPDQDRLRPLHVELLKMQRHVADTGARLLAIFEGRDAAGKGTAIRRITEHLNPRGCRIVALPKPTERERSQWYFQRHAAHLPAAGEIVIFDRSWYNRAGLERVMGFCTPEEAETFLEAVPALERMLVRDGIRLFKLYFTVTRAEQARRLERRRIDPLQAWKTTPLDLEAQARWDDYTRAEAEMFRRTSTREAPWTLIDANDLRRARVQTIRYLLASVDYPDRDESLVEVDPAVVRVLGPGGRP